MENLQNEEILLELIDIVMGNKQITELPQTELAFENHGHSNNSGYVYEIEHLLSKLGLFNYGNEFSNIYHLWNKYKYNLNHELVQNEELENELWGVLLNAELVHKEEQELMAKEDVQSEEHYEDDFEEESNEENEENEEDEENENEETKTEEVREETKSEEVREETKTEEVKAKNEEENTNEEEIDNSSWCVII